MEAKQGLPWSTGSTSTATSTSTPRGDLLRRLGRRDEARAEYDRALELAHIEPKRRFLQRRIADVGA